VVANEEGTWRWTPAATSIMDVPAGAHYRSLASGPDGGALWAAPSARYAEDLADVTTAESGDPACLRLQASINTARRDRAE
jgi:hypothetical protein